MKPAAFRYAAPRSVAEALDCLAAHGDEAKVLAGGQSLGPLLNLRLASPSVLVDLNRVAELDTPPADNGDTVTLGAMTRQSAAERSPVVASRLPLMAEALPYVAHRTIRNRGTVGGSLAHADPAAELPAVAVALDALLTVRSSRGARTVAADDFYQGYFTTSLEADEIIESIDLRCHTGATGSAWREFAPRHGDYGIVGVAAVVGLSEDRTVSSARLVCSGIADRPQRLPLAEERLRACRVTEQALTEAGRAARTAGNPVDDLVATSDYRRHLLEVLTTRAVRAAAERAERGAGAAD